MSIMTPEQEKMSSYFYHQIMEAEVLITQLICIARYRTIHELCKKDIEGHFGLVRTRIQPRGGMKASRAQTKMLESSL